MNKYFMQDEALKLSKIFPECPRLKTVANNCCCASVALDIMGIDPKNHLEIIADELGKGLRDDCTVLWQPFFKNVSGREITVEFRDNIKSLKDLKDVKGICAVCFAKGEFEHWVGVQNCEIVYNTKKESNCVKNGKPVKARIIKYK